MNFIKDTAISYWLGYTILPVSTRVKMLKENGFDSIEIYWTNEYKELNGDIYEIANNCLKCGLNISSLHTTFNRSNLIWIDSLEGEALFNEYKQTITDAKNFNCNTVVIHADGKGNSDVFLKRINELDSYAQKLGITLCVENLQIDDNIEFVCKNTKLSLCFDVGHYNIKQSKTMLKYLNRIKYMHIHDNDGQHDLHLIPGEGNVNYNDEIILKSLSLNCPKLLEVHDTPQNTTSLKEYKQYLKRINLFIKNGDSL